jgi:hypothetical protein
MAYWYISRTKLKFEGKEKIDPIDLDKWRSLVESDNDLVWYEETALGIEDLFGNSTTPSERRLRLKTSARMDINKSGNGSVQLNYLNKDGYRYIPILHTMETLKRIEKYFQIAQLLEANLYKNKTLIDEKKMEQLREKYKAKGGKQAPNEE